MKYVIMLCCILTFTPSYAISDCYEVFRSKNSEHSFATLITRRDAPSITIETAAVEGVQTSFNCTTASYNNEVILSCFDVKGQLISWRIDPKNFPDKVMVTIVPYLFDGKITRLYYYVRGCVRV